MIFGKVELDACGGQKHKVAKALAVPIRPRWPHVIAGRLFTTGLSKQKKQIYCFILRMALRRRSISDVGMAVVDGLAAVKIA